MNKHHYSGVFRVPPKKSSASYASVLGGDLQTHEATGNTSDETSPEPSTAASGERVGDRADADAEKATPGAVAAAAGRGCALVGEVYLPAFSGDQSTHPVDFLVDIEAWLVSRHIAFESWVDVAVERLFGSARAWALVRYPQWGNWSAFRAAFLARFWNEAAKMELVDQFFSSKYSRKEFGSTANYAMFWLNKVKHLLLEKTNGAYSLDRFSFLTALGHQLPPEARAFLQGARNLSNEELLAGLRRSDRLPGRDHDAEVDDDYSQPFF